MNWFTKAALWVSQPFRLSDPGAAQMLGESRDSYSGKTVTVDNALTLSAIWASVRILSEIMGGMPIGMYREDDFGNGVLDRKHPLHQVLRHQPNADMTAFEFWQSTVACLVLWGNAYAEIARNIIGDVVSLTPMMPQRVVVRRLSNGSLAYDYTDPLTSSLRTLSEDEVMHVKGFSLNGIVGLSRIQYARHSLGASMSTDEAAGKIFANGLRPSALYSVKEYLKKEQRERWNEILSEHSGNSNRGGHFLLEGGATFEALTIPPEDAQMLQTREYNVDDACRWMGVPPWMIGHTTRTTSWGTGMEQQMIGFKITSLKPISDAICGAIWKCLLRPEQRGSVTAKHDFNDLMRADSTGRAALIGVQAQNGVRTRNELRAMDGLPPLPGGDALTVQSNLVPLEKLGEAPPAQTPADFGIHKPAASPNKEPADAQ